MIRKGIYVLFLVLAQIAFAQEEDLCIDQPPDESFPEEDPPQPHFSMYYNPTMDGKVEPFWKRLRHIYCKPEHNHLTIIRIDCTSRKDICIRQNITDFPTFKFFRGGHREGITFHGKLDIVTLTAFIDDQMKKAETAGDE